MAIALSFRTEEHVRDRLDQAAKEVDRNRNWVINDAIKAYLERRQWEHEEIEAGIAESDAGKGITTSELRARLRKSGTRVKA